MKFLKHVKSLGVFFSLIGALPGYASSSLSVGGHAGAVGQYLHGMPPLINTYTAFQVPVGLILQANPTDDFSVIMELDYAYSNYPVTTTLMGETNATKEANAHGNAIPMPFANSVNWGGPLNPFGQKVDTVTIVQAYLAYQTPIGLFRAGRMPRDWGLGIWYDSYWTAQGSGISTTDALAFTTDFGLYDVSLYYEKYGQSVGGYFNNGSATGYTVEGRLKTDPNDIASNGISRNVGLIYSKFIHQQSSTDLNILDVYGKFYFSRFFIGAEVLFPSGQTRNANYQTLGGAPLCKSPVSDSKTCSSQTIASLGALMKMRFRFDDPSKNSTLYAVDKSLTLLGTRERQNSHIGEIWMGYASGGKNQFAPENEINIASNRITAIRLNPNILPALLMFTNTTPLINGMPTASITNSTFARASYTYQSNKWGSLSPAVIWGMINSTSEYFNNNNPACKSTPELNFSNSVNNFCVGNSRNLGTELDLTYAYTTEHMITGQVDAGYWMVGKAWERKGQILPYSTFGIRAILSTQW